MIEVRCPKCGAAMEAPDSQAGQGETCPECGNVTLVPTPTRTENRGPQTNGTAAVPVSLPPPIAPAPPSALSPPSSVVGRCPACGSEQTQKVSIAYAAGTRRGGMTGGAVAITGDGLVPVIGGGGSRSQTDLARQLAPPRPAQHYGFLAVLLGFVLGVFLLAAVLGKDGPTWLAVTLPVLPVVGSIWLARHDARRAALYNARVCGPALDHWNAQWICLRCGQRWVPAGPPAVTTVLR